MCMGPCFNFRCTWPGGWWKLNINPGSKSVLHPQLKDHPQEYFLQEPSRAIRDTKTILNTRTIMKLLVILVAIVTISKATVDFGFQVDFCDSATTGYPLLGHDPPDTCAFRFATPECIEKRLKRVCSDLPSCAKDMCCEKKETCENLGSK